MTISFDRIADIYDKTRGFPDDAMERIIEFLIKELKDQEFILDVGVGTGRFAKPLQDAGLNVIGIDISDKMLDKALEKGTMNLVKGDIRALPFKDKVFGISMSVHALHLIKEWETALMEIARTTKKSLLTIARDSSDYERTPSGLYKDLLKQLGYSYEHPGVGEWTMKDRIKLARTEFITSYKSNVERSIGHLNDRVYSFQWQAPNDLHEKAMRELKKRFRGISEYANDVYLYEWDVDVIKRYQKQHNMPVSEKDAPINHQEL